MVTVAWRSAAKASMKASGRTRQDVAEKVGLSGSYLTMLVNGKYGSSTHLDALSNELGIQTSGALPATPAVQELLENANELSEEMLQNLLQFVRSLRDADKTKH